MKYLNRFLFFGAVLVLLFFGFVFLSTYQPGDVEEVEVSCRDDAPVYQQGDSLKVFNWNVQFMAGRDNHFFYSGGPDTRPTAEEIDETLKESAELIKDENPDVILLQEMDNQSARTDGRNQANELMKLLPDEYNCIARTWYWKAAFIPHPSVMGSAGMELVTISKYRIESAQRLALPEITSQNYIMKQFYLKRAILKTMLKTGSEREIAVMNTHLSAFARGDDTMRRQIDKVMSIIENLNSQSIPWLIGGDFNLLPNKKQYNRLPEKLRSGYNPDTELAPLINSYKSIPSASDLKTDTEGIWHTASHDIPGELVPNRTIDYIFYSDLISVKDKKVLGRAGARLSDHSPVIGVFSYQQQN